MVTSVALAPTLKREASEPRLLNERPVEYRYAFDQLVKARAHRVLDVGTGTTAWPALLANCGYQVTAMDSVDSYWTGAFSNRHWKIERRDITSPSVEGEFDAVTCLSVLEHIPDHRGAVRAMMGLLAPGGRLIITGPWNDTTYVEDAYQMPDAGYGRDAGFICRIYSEQQLAAWMTDTGASLESKELFRVFEGELWTQGARVRPPEAVSGDTPHHLACLTLVKPRSADSSG